MARKYYKYNLPIPKADAWKKSDWKTKNLRAKLKNLRKDLAMAQHSAMAAEDILDGTDHELLFVNLLFVREHLDNLLNKYKGIAE